MATTEWFMDMASAMAKRSHAVMMLGKWQDKVQAAEEEINRLADERQVQEQAAPEAAPE